MDDILDVEDIITKLKSSLPICRVCLDVSMEYIEFEATLCIINGQEITFSDGFNELSPDYKYLGHENIPTYFCATCGKDLLNAYLFIKRTERANDTLNKIKNITKEESPSKCVTNKELFPSAESENNRDNSKIEEILPDKCVSNILETNDLIKLENNEEEYDYEEIFTHEEESMEKENTLIQPEIQINNQESDKWEINWNVTDHVTTMLVCNLCGFLSETEAGLDKHKKSEHENIEIELVPNKLTDSHLLFHEFSDTKTNLDPEKKENKNYNCNICSCTFETKKSLNIHNVRTHKIIKTNGLTEQEELKSQDCIQTVPISFMETSSTNKSNEYSCTHCEKTFPTKIALKHHSNTHSKNPNRYNCHICGKCCSRPSTLKKHIQFKHKVERKKYQCEECGLFFPYPSNLKEHRRKHDTSIQFSCTHCNRTFLRKPQLEIHMRYHLNHFPYKCDKCDKCYVTKSNLTDHIRSKHTKTTFDCDKCKQKFKSQTGLRKHKYIHDGYPYNCPLCTIGQTSRSGMKQHLLGVHKDALTEEEFDVMFPIIIPRTGYRRPKDYLLIE